MENQKILIAAAWPYANGSLHLGHISSLIGADILARYFRLSGKDVLYVSGSDCHGTPIVYEAIKQNVSPEDIAEKYHKEFKENLIQGLGFSYDCYTNTLTENHKETVQEIFLDLYEKGLIYKKEEELPYCPSCKMFLPDRYIEGECPYCHFPSARGDQCDECGSLINTKELINPRCKHCGSKPEWRNSEHFYLKLSAFEEDLKQWIEKSEGWRRNAKNFSLNFVEQGLKDRAITRDIDWGVPIPIEGYESKRMYVWFEAVCGYLSASKEARSDWESFWMEDPFHYYVHGKDNIPFHTIIWPSILLGRGELHLPDRIFSSEYLTLEGRQFSKSRKWAVWLPYFLENYEAETLRYYLISNGTETADADFSWKEYQMKTNNELIANFGNLINRTFSFISKNYSKGVFLKRDFTEKEADLDKRIRLLFEDVGLDIEQGKFKEGLKKIFSLIDAANKYLEETSPWAKEKDDAERVLAFASHLIKNISILINPFLPETSEKIFDSLKMEVNSWEYFELDETIIHKLSPLYKKIEDEQVTKEEEALNNNK